MNNVHKLLLSVIFFHHFMFIKVLTIFVFNASLRQIVQKTKLVKFLNIFISKVKFLPTLAFINAKQIWIVKHMMKNTVNIIFHKLKVLLLDFVFHVKKMIIVIEIKNARIIFVLQDYVKNTRIRALAKQTKVAFLLNLYAFNRRQKTNVTKWKT